MTAAEDGRNIRIVAALTDHVRLPLRITYRWSSAPWGHSNAQTAMIYQHPSMEDVRVLVNACPLVQGQGWDRPGTSPSTSHGEKTYETTHAKGFDSMLGPE
jgi:hypothetical protein